MNLLKKIRDWGESDMGWKDWAFFPVGATKLAVKGGVYGKDLLDPSGSPQSKSERDLRASMSDAADSYAAYRPQVAQAHMNAMANVRDLYSPTVSVMNEMTGGRFPMPTQAMTRPVMGGQGASAMSAVRSPTTGYGPGGPTGPVDWSQITNAHQSGQPSLSQLTYGRG